jgi:protein subunit release factor A
MNIPITDLKIERLHAERHGLGGQQTNGPEDPGIRITHLPSGTVSVCELHRSQMRNRKTCIDMIELALASVK